MFRRALLSIVAFVASGFLFACSEARRDSPTAGVRTLSEIRSPAGWCVASTVEIDAGKGSQNTQVFLAFDGGCGAGAVAFDGLNLGLQLRWLDDTSLEVGHPQSASPTRNANGEIIQCFKRKVRVILTPQHLTNR